MDRNDVRVGGQIVTVVRKHTIPICYIGLGPPNRFEGTVFFAWLKQLPLWQFLISKFSTTLMLSLSFQQSWFQISNLLKLCKQALA